MKQQAGEVMTAWIQTIKVTIHHVGNPGQRVPVAVVAGAKGPLDTLGTYPGLHVEIAGDVFGIVEIDKLVMSDRPVTEQRHSGEQEANAFDGTKPRMPDLPRV